MRDGDKPAVEGAGVPAGAAAVGAGDGLVIRRHTSQSRHRAAVGPAVIPARAA